MKISYGVAAAGTTLMLATAQSRAEIAEKIYLSTDVGVAITQNSGVRASPLGNTGNVKFDTGLRAGLTAGYDVLPLLSVELETGVIWNPVQSIGANTLSSLASKADLFQIPLLANIVYKPLYGAFQPYIGVGCGGAASIFEGTSIPLFGTSFDDTDFAFAYQGEAGFKYALGDHVELGVGYKFLGTSGHDWKDQGVTFKTEGTKSHSILASFTWRF